MNRQQRARFDAAAAEFAAATAHLDDEHLDRAVKRLVGRVRRDRTEERQPVFPSVWSFVPAATFSTIDVRLTDAEEPK